MLRLKGVDIDISPKDIVKLEQENSYVRLEVKGYFFIDCDMSLDFILSQLNKK